MKITEFFVKRPTLFWSLMVGILLVFVGLILGFWFYNAKDNGGVIEE